VLRATLWVLTLFRRHLTNCRHRPKGRKHRSCQCPLWVVAFADEIGVKYISQLTAERMVTFRAGWTDSPISALKKLERLRSFFRFCVGMKWVEENPVGTLKPPKFHQKPTLPFTGEEFERVLAAVERYPTKNSFGYDNRARLRAFVLLLKYSGLRIRDAVCLRRNRIVDGKLMVYTQKTEQPVYVPLPPVVVESFEKSGRVRVRTPWSGRSRNFPARWRIGSTRTWPFRLGPGRPGPSPISGRCAYHLVARAYIPKRANLQGLFACFPGERA
jgi:integrase